jgi:hypothetical protein
LLGGSIEKGRLEFALNGRQLKGVFVLTRMSGKKREWLLIKKRDEFGKDDFLMTTRLTPALRKELKVKVPPCTAS